MSDAEPAPTATGAGPAGRGRRMATRAETHPWLFGLALGVTTVVGAYAVYIGFDLFLRHVLGRYPAILAETLTAAVSLSVVRWFRWARECGFSPLREWRSRYLLWWLTPFVLLAWAGVADHPTVRAPDLLVATLVLTVLIGISEETLFRGLLLRAFLPRGARRAVVSQGLLFGLFHLTNLVGGLNPAYVAFEVVVVALLGIFLGALRLRVNSIWPVIAIHALVDFGALVSHGYQLGATAPPTSSILFDTVLYGAMAAIGILLVRPSKMNPAPAAVAPVVLSPDGYYIWAGGTWRPAQYSPDRYYVWDGAAWRRVPAPAAGLGP